MTHKEKMKRVRRAEKTVSKLAGMNLIYKLGGARGGSKHNAIENPTASGVPWTDCSGFALYLMSVMGIKADDPAGWTGTLVGEGTAGESDYFTLYIKEPFNVEGHVIVRLRKRPRPWHRGQTKYRWAECGGRDNPKSGGGPTWFKPTLSRIAEFPEHRRFAL